MLTVKDLRKALRGIPGDTPVFTRDHDHGEYEWNGRASSARLLNQRDMEDHEKKNHDDIFKVKGNYFVISV